jgi:hypothetical protein
MPLKVNSSSTLPDFRRTHKDASILSMNLSTRGSICTSTRQTHRSVISIIILAWARDYTSLSKKKVNAELLNALTEINIVALELACANMKLKWNTPEDTYGSIGRILTGVRTLFSLCTRSSLSVNMQSTVYSSSTSRLSFKMLPMHV